MLALGVADVVAWTGEAAAQGRRRRRPRRPRHPATEVPTSAAPERDDEPDAPDGPASTGEAHAAAVPSATESARADEPARAAARGPQPPAIDLFVALRVVHRDLSYHQDLYDELRGYELPAAPAVSVALQWYPGAHFSAGPASWFGLTGTFDYAFVADSRDVNGVRFGTEAWGFSAGLRVRIPLGLSDVALAGAYGRQRYAIANANAVDPRVPDVDYDFVRAGVATRLAFGSRVALSVEGAYLVVLGAGEVMASQYFPRATAGGVDASLGLSVALGFGLEARVGVALRRFFYAMHSEPGDVRVAGGAVDQYVLVDAGIALRR